MAVIKTGKKIQIMKKNCQLEVLLLLKREERVFLKLVLLGRRNCHRHNHTSWVPLSSLSFPLLCFRLSKITLLDSFLAPFYHSLSLSLGFFLCSSSIFIKGLTTIHLPPTQPTTLNIYTVQVETAVLVALEEEEEEKPSTEQAPQQEEEAEAAVPLTTTHTATSAAVCGGSGLRKTLLG